MLEVNGSSVYASSYEIFPGVKDILVPPEFIITISILPVPIFLSICRTVSDTSVVAKDPSGFLSLGILFADPPGISCVIFPISFLPSSFFSFLYLSRTFCAVGSSFTNFISLRLFTYLIISSLSFP